MAVEANKAVARRFFEEVWNGRDLAVIEEVFAPNVVLNGQQSSPARIKELVAARLAAFPDISVTVDEQVAEADRVSTLRTWQGTHQGTFRGIPPTGKHATWSQISIVRVLNGKIVEDRVVTDELSLLEQLGCTVQRNLAAAESHE